MSLVYVISLIHACIILSAVNVIIKSIIFIYYVCFFVVFRFCVLLRLFVPLKSTLWFYMFLRACWPHESDDFSENSLVWFFCSYIFNFYAFFPGIVFVFTISRLRNYHGLWIQWNSFDFSVLFLSPWMQRFALNQRCV